MRDLRSISNMVVASILGVTAIISVSILTNALIRVKRAGELIHVTGSAHKIIRSDYIIWQSTITEEKPTVAEAYAKIKADAAQVQAYLIAQGIPSQEIFPLPIQTRVLHPPLEQGYNSDDPSVVRPILGYRLIQRIQVRSNSVEKVDHIARNATELMRSGIPVTSEAPQYIYSQMDSLKLTMLNVAAQDARDRADRIAANCGSRAGELRYARTGVTQVEALSATDDVTDSGANDTSSFDKKVTAIVKADFSIR